MKNYFVLQKKIDYKGCPIYVRNKNELWEYFCIIDNELYTAHIIAKKKFFQNKYTTKQINDITNYMIAMAQTTIEMKLGESKI